MRRRRSSIAADSLDLLLDTITNTFGGILLLALLLVLLVRNVNEPTDQAAKASEKTPAEQKADLQMQFDQLVTQRDILQQSLAAQSLFNSGSADDTQSQQLMQQLSQLLKAVGAIRAEQVAQNSQLDQLKSQSATQADLMAKLTADSGRLQDEVQAADAELKKEQLRRTQTMDLPKEEVTSKRMAVAVVKGNQLFLVQENPGLNRFQFNSKHFKKSNMASAQVVLSDGTCLEVRPENGAAMKANELSSELSNVDPNDFFLTIAIANDSFGSFAELRSTCVNLGLEYRIIPVSEFPVVEGPTSQLPTAQ